MATLTKTLTKQFKVVNLTGKKFKVLNTWEYPSIDFNTADGESFDMRLAFRDITPKFDPYADLEVCF